MRLYKQSQKVRQDIGYSIMTDKLQDNDSCLEPKDNYG